MFSKSYFVGLSAVSLVLSVVAQPISAQQQPGTCSDARECGLQASVLDGGLNLAALAAGELANHTTHRERSDGTPFPAVGAANPLQADESWKRWPSLTDF